MDHDTHEGQASPVGATEDPLTEALCVSLLPDSAKRFSCIT